MHHQHTDLRSMDLDAAQAAVERACEEFKVQPYRVSGACVGCSVRLVRITVSHTAILELALVKGCRKSTGAPGAITPV